MKKIIRNILIAIASIIVLIAIAGIIKFNIIQDDAYVVEEDGSVVQYNEEGEVVGPTVNIETSQQGDIACKDSDGLDYYSKGATEVCDFTLLEEPGGSSVGCALHEDFCPTEFDDPTGQELYEYYCVGDELKFEKYICPNGCFDGVCIR